MMYRLEISAVQSLIQVLHQQRYTVIGPIRQDGAIVYDEIQSVSDLPIGWTDEQHPGSYRLQDKQDKTLFGFTVGPYSWKKFLFPPVRQLFSARRNKKGFTFNAHEGENLPDEQRQYAFFGVRPCELAAIGIQDKVFASGQYQDPYYRRIRDGIFIVAINCSVASETCFCASMGTGPKAQKDFDLALTEVADQTEHFFVAETGSAKGEQMLGSVPRREVRTEERTQSEEVVRKTAAQIKRSINTNGLKDLLYQNFEHPEWEEVARRCLSCTNCTMVCPTCFCSTVEDTTDLDGVEAVRSRKWDSCFTLDFSYIHGGSVRTTTKSRYRQWMTHKLASWVDQFGAMGCVGCGRCITWCPVGIDITDEARVIRESNGLK